MFFITVTLIILIIVFLLVLFILSLKRYRERAWTHAWQFFVPSILAVISVFLIMKFFMPYALDVVDIVRGQLNVRRVTVQRCSAMMLETVDNEEIRYSPLEHEIEEGKQYIIYSTPRSNYIIHASKLES